LKTELVVDKIRLALRPAEAGDDEFLYHVYASTRSDELALVNWTDEQKEAFLRMQIDAQVAHYKIHFPTAEQYIIQREDVPVGRLILNRLNDMLHIIDIALLTEARNTGIGSTVMKEIMDEAQQSNRQVMLRVEFFNPARRLYSRLGFVQTREFSIYHEMVWPPEEQRLEN
jgi:ribosomal protein S18 acetylase RimI-like enzyme